MFCALGLSVMALFFCASATAATSYSLFDMMEQLDKSDKQDFQSAVDKAIACIWARNFQCSATELARAAKTANSGQDKKILLASQNSLANEQQQVANDESNGDGVTSFSDGKVVLTLVINGKDFDGIF